MSRAYFPIPNFVDNPEPTAELLSALLSIVKPLSVSNAQAVLDGDAAFKLQVVEKVAVTVRPGTNQWAIVPSVLEEAEKEITDEAVDYFRREYDFTKVKYGYSPETRPEFIANDLVCAIMMKTLIHWLLPDAEDKANWPKYYAKNR